MRARMAFRSEGFRNWARPVALAAPYHAVAQRVGWSSNPYRKKREGVPEKVGVGKK
jgi:hypothetical protein